MSSVGLSSFGPIGIAGPTPLPQSLLGAAGGSFGPQPVIRRTAIDLTATTTRTAPTPAPASPAAAAPSAQAAPVRAATGAHGAGGASATAAAAAATVDALISGYSTTVGGKQYLAGLLETGGEYTASIASVPGAIATETSEQAAENGLDMRIDELV